MDLLSDLLASLTPQSYVSGGVALNSNTAVQWPHHAGIKCYAVISGECWLSVTGIAGAVHLRAGECYLLPPGPAFYLATSLHATPVDFALLRAGGQLPGDILNIDKEGCFLVGGHFSLCGQHAELLLSSLPAIVHISKEADKTAMRWSLERMAEEVRYPQPGGALITQQLAYTMIIQALRLYLNDEASKGRGWLFALADKHLSVALSCIHQQPEHPWTLQLLAKQAGMSRSVFALRFRETVGIPAIEYLTRWRMLLACNRLKNDGEPISLVSLALGYQSENAFGKAFKRVIGCTPGQYSRRSAE